MERGEFITCKAPYGYRLRDGKDLEIFEEAAVIRQIFARYLAGENVGENAAALTGMAQDYGVGGSDLLALRQRLDELTAEQGLLLDKVLEDMDNPDLNAQLKTLAEEKQGILEQMATSQEKAERQALQAYRRRELEEWLGRQPMMFTEYDDGITRRLVERITVVDAGTIRVKLRDTDVEIEQRLC